MIQFRDLLGTLFRREDAANTQKVRTRKKGRNGDRPYRPRAAREKIRLEQFAATVRRLFLTDERKVVGSFQFLNLASARDHFGTEWRRVAPKIFAVVESTLEARLGPDDCHARIGEASYVVVFTHLEVQAAAMKAALIANEISKKLFGEVSTSLIQVGVAEVESEEIADLQMMKPLALAKALASKAETPISIGPKVDANSHAVAGVSVPAPGGMPTPNTGQQVPAPETGAEDQNQDADQVETANNAEPENVWVFAEVEIERTPEWKYYRETHQIPADLHFAYFPAWLVRRDMIAAHSCVPARLGPAGQMLTGTAALPAQRRAIDNFAVDTLALMKAQSDIANSLRGKMPAVIALPIHLETISTPRFRDSYISVAARLTDQMRRQLIIEITGFADEIPAFTFAKIADTLRPFCRQMTARVTLEARNFGFLHNLGIHAVGVDIRRLNYSASRTFQLMDGFNERAQKSRMATFIHGLQSRSEVSGAVAAGFRYLDGPIIASPITAPESNRPWTAKDVYASLIFELARIT